MSAPVDLVALAGGVGALREVIETFYAAVFADPMIGFYFRGQDHARLIERELELIAEHLGAPGVRYAGRPLDRAHARHRIFRGHFDRRTVILREAMEAHGLPEPVRAAWLAHTEALRPQIMGEDCR